jgi:hypothetical protein
VWSLTLSAPLAFYKFDNWSIKTIVGQNVVKRETGPARVDIADQRVTVAILTDEEPAQAGFQHQSKEDDRRVWFLQAPEMNYFSKRNRILIVTIEGKQSVKHWTKSLMTPDADNFSHFLSA